MNEEPRRRTPFAATPGWPERIAALIITATLVVLGFFFLAAALVAGSVIAAVVVARWWWLARKLRRARDRDIVEGEYTIVRRSERSGRIPPPDQ